MSKINLLYVIEGGPTSGAEHNLLRVIKAIDKTRYKTGVCLFGPSDTMENELKGLGVPVFVLGAAGKWDILSYIRLIRFMHLEKIDIVHTCLYYSNTIGRIAAIIARAPVIIAWETGEVLESMPARHCKIDRILAKLTDCVVAPSKDTKEKMIKREGIPAHKIRVIYNCADIDNFKPTSDASVIKRQLGIMPDEILIGTVSHLFERKGLQYLIRAIPQIIKVYPKAKFLLVGGREQFCQLKSYFIQIIERLNITDKVIMTGFRKDIPDIMNALDLYVCSSLREAFGVAVLEAMSLKKPVVSTNVDGMPEMVMENQTGYLVPPKDPDSIACAVIKMLANRDKMLQMGNAGFKRAKEKFSSEVIAKEIEALYEELLWKIHTKSQYYIL